MDLNHLRAFIAVADCGQLTRAAERLHLSQPAVSHQIKMLEEALGQRLFERTASGMELTPVGRQLIEQAQCVLAAAEELKQAARALHGHVSGRLRIGTLSDPQFIRLGEFLARTVERYPLLELELRGTFTGGAMEQVRDGSLDASFFVGDISHENVAGLRLGEMSVCVVAPAEWAPRVLNADWDAIAAMPWILPPRSSSFSPLLGELFGKHSAQPVKLVEADNEGVATNLVESGVGVSLMREDRARERQAAGALCIWEPARMTMALWFICLADRAADPLIEALREVLREVWQLQPDGSFHRQKRPGDAKAARRARPGKA